MKRIIYTLEIDATDLTQGEVARKLVIAAAEVLRADTGVEIGVQYLLGGGDVAGFFNDPRLRK